ncbi:hypothetical protein P4V88_02280 [Bacillus thuringiensis]|uniref:hypothetical protein n=1 Tax=Bacillus thuringiensis TaxID=1428 RepID=UPI000A37682F|nr:hypothetical protein [Bacillus thuringiensis]MED2125970.1 hypothetical protein [Bacillus thuringiensis]MED2148666.1 hypothetical protein [Bacillus thuringiensis]MED2170802.1 hypothetical protein [Bacillus thuringiensis]MED2475910.1 hypothetical protein [Bacillus thuringiensis]MED2578374.1 hypothetical protein [Bacillus thuringiensis]
MDIREQVLTKYNELNEFLNSISLDDLRKQFNRHELNEFKSNLYNTKLRSLAYEISKMTDEMKIEEFPQLLGVHHFPILNEIDFLTEEQKINLDKELVRYRVGNYVSGLWKITRDESKRKQLLKWLLDNGILETKYAALCPYCHNGNVTDIMTTQEKDKLDSMFSDYKKAYDEDLEEKLQDILENVCMECNSFTEVDDLKELKYTEYHQMKKERDNSLDNA